jgi:hypothetical protein
MRLKEIVSFKNCQVLDIIGKDDRLNYCKGFEKKYKKRVSKNLNTLFYLFRRKSYFFSSIFLFNSCNSSKSPKVDFSTP